MLIMGQYMTILTTEIFSPENGDVEPEPQLVLMFMGDNTKTGISKMLTHFKTHFKKLL